MNLGAMVLVLLSTDGYWFGGSIATIGFQCTVRDAAFPAELTWRLQNGDALLGQGESPLKAEGAIWKSPIEVPKVRLPIDALFVWRIHRKEVVQNSNRQNAGSPSEPRHNEQARVEPRQNDPFHTGHVVVSSASNGKTILGQGSVTVHIYPQALLAVAAKLLVGKQLLVWDQREGLPAVLAAERVALTVVGDEGQLAFTHPDVLIVAANQLSRRPEGQQPVMNLAVAGVNVLILSQSGSNMSSPEGGGNGQNMPPSRLAGYLLTRRRLPPKLQWRDDHPLSTHLKLFERPERLGSMSAADAETAGDAWAIRLPADDAALEIAWWPAEVLGRAPVEKDVLVVSKTVNKGRITMCQMALGSWQTDPRSQLFLADAIDYLVSPATPTPPETARLNRKKVQCEAMSLEKATQSASRSEDGQLSERKP